MTVSSFVFLFPCFRQFDSKLMAFAIDRGRNKPQFIEDFVTKNPIDNCKHPTPSPPCVICEDGTEVCSNAPFPGGAKKEKY